VTAKGIRRMGHWVGWHCRDILLGVSSQRGGGEPHLYRWS